MSDELAKAQEAFWQRCLSFMSDPGWGVIGVGADPENDLPGFNYTYGLEENYAHPELCVVGLGYQQAHAILNDIVRTIVKSKDQIPVFLDREYENFLSNGYKIRFIQVTEPFLSEHITVARRIQPDYNIRCLQMLWPDANGVFPDQNNFDEKMISRQPLWRQ